MNRTSDLLPAPFEEYDGDGLKKYVDIQEQRPVLDVEIVIPYFVLGFKVIIAPDLRKTSQARLDGQTNTLEDSVTSYEEGSFRSWANQAHIALEDIEQLGKLIKASSPQEFSYGSDSRIILCSQNGAGVLFGIINHRSELMECEQLSVFADSFLFEEDRPLVFEPYEKCDKKPQWEGNDESGERQKNIKGSFQKSSSHLISLDVF